jgi:hypothetical protein
MTFTIPEFWCGFIAGVVCTILMLAGLAAGQMGRQKRGGR